MISIVSTILRYVKRGGSFDPFVEFWRDPDGDIPCLTSSCVGFEDDSIQAQVCLVNADGTQIWMSHARAQKLGFVGPKQPRSIPMTNYAEREQRRYRKLHGITPPTD